MEAIELITLAKKAMQQAYVPYSGFKVGAALLGASGQIYLGCNVENAAYSACNCAERTAFFKAVSEGEREFAAISVVGGPNGEIKDFCPPCGVCRQVMQEFCQPEFPIYLCNGNDEIKEFTLAQLLPESFSADKM